MAVVLGPTCYTFAQIAQESDPHILGEEWFGVKIRYSSAGPPIFWNIILPHTSDIPGIILEYHGIILEYYFDPQ